MWMVRSPFGFGVAVEAAGITAFDEPVITPVVGWPRTTSFWLSAVGAVETTALDEPVMVPVVGGGRTTVSPL
jgi:hypothetical protein